MMNFKRLFHRKNAEDELKELLYRKGFNSGGI